MKTKVIRPMINRVRREDHRTAEEADGVVRWVWRRLCELLVSYGIVSGEAEMGKVGLDIF